MGEKKMRAGGTENVRSEEPKRTNRSFLNDMSGDFTFDKARSGALIVATLSFYVFWFLAMAIGWIPDFFELLALKGVIDPISNTVASFTTWIQAFVFSLLIIVTLVPNNPQRKLSLPNILPAAVCIVYDFYPIIENLVTYYALDHSFRKGGDNCKIQSLFATDVPIANMSSSYAALPFCSHSEVSYVCMSSPSCKLTIAESLVQLKFCAITLVILLIGRTIIWCKVAFGKGKSMVVRRHQVKMEYVRKRLRKQSDQKNGRDIKEQTFTEGALSNAREVRDTVSHFFFGDSTAQKSTKTVNSLSYLPSVILVAHTVSLLFVIALSNYVVASIG
jgi:hypothetical protein